MEILLVITSSLDTRKVNSCSTKYCRKPRGKNRRVCYSCQKRKTAENHPIKNAYYNLRTNAKRRGKQFDLTFEEFRKWAVETEYMLGKGKSKHSFHVDRIREYEGYNINNLQILTNSENKKKHLKYVMDQKGKPVDYHFEETKDHPQGDCPF